MLLNRSKAYLAAGLVIPSYHDVTNAVLLLGLGAVTERDKDREWMSKVLSAVEAYPAAIAFLRPITSIDSQEPVHVQRRRRLVELERLVATKKAEPEKDAAPRNPPVNTPYNLSDSQRARASDIHRLSMGALKYAPVFLPDFHDLLEHKSRDPAHRLNLRLADWGIELFGSDRIDMGFGIRARRNFARGEVLLRDPPFLFGSVSADHCSVCGLLLKCPVPCERGCGDAYCSVECREQAASLWHRVECSYFDRVIVKQLRPQAKDGCSMSSRGPLLLARLLAMSDPDRYLFEQHPTLRDLSCPNMEGVFLSGLQATLSYAKTVERFQLNPLWFDFVTFDHLRLLLMNNAFAMSTEDERNANTLGFAAVVYDAASFFNHSCVPNASWRLDEQVTGNRIEIKAAAEIREGEEIFITYIPLESDPGKRADALRQYGFTCRCPACQIQREPNTVLTATELRRLARFVNSE